MVKSLSAVSGEIMLANFLYTPRFGLWKDSVCPLCPFKIDIAFGIEFSFPQYNPIAFLICRWNQRLHIDAYNLWPNSCYCYLSGLGSYLQVYNAQIQSGTKQT